MNVKFPAVIIQQAVDRALIDGIQKKVAWAVIMINWKILLCKRTEDEFMPWLIELPSGNIDSWESIIDWLCREVYEETWLEVDSIEYYIWRFDYTSWSGKKARQFNFIVNCKSGDIKLNPQEHSEYFLIEPSDIPATELKISESTKKVLIDSTTYLGYKS